MAIVIILAYVGILFGLVKIGLIKWTPFWKASPVLLLILLILRIPSGPQYLLAAIPILWLASPEA